MSESLNYRCNDCGHVWEGDEFTLDCENCSSSDIEIAKELTQRINKEDLPEDKTLSSDEVKGPAPDDSGTIVIPKEPEAPKEEVKEEKPKATESPKPSPQPPKEEVKPVQEAPKKPEPKPTPEKPKQEAPKPAASAPKSEASHEKPKTNTGGGSNAGKASKDGGSGSSGGGKAWIIILLIVILGAAGAYFFMNQDDDAKDSDQKGDSSEQVEDRLELKLKVTERDQAFYLSGSLIEGNSEEKLDLTKVERLYRVTDEREYSFDAETGQIYFCEDQTGMTVFGADISDKQVTETTSDAVELSLFGKAPAAEANCVYRLDNSKIGVDFTSDCKMVVKINDDHKFNSLLVSITGQEGPFKNRFTWDVSSMGQQKVNVWVKQDDLEAIAYERNGDAQIPVCVQANPENPDKGPDLEQMIRDLAEAATKFGLNPRDRAAAANLQKLSMSLPTQPKFVIDGQTVSGFSAGTNRMKTSYRNDGTTYVLSGAPEIVDNKYFKISYRSK